MAAGRTSGDPLAERDAIITSSLLAHKTTFLMVQEFHCFFVFQFVVRKERAGKKIFLFFSKILIQKSL